MMDYLNLFIGEEYFTHATQDEDHGYRVASPHIEAIEKDYTLRHGRGHAIMNGYDDDSLYSDFSSMSITTSSYDYPNEQSMHYPLNCETKHDDFQH